MFPLKPEGSVQLRDVGSGVSLRLCHCGCVALGKLLTSLNPSLLSCKLGGLCPPRRGSLVRLLQQPCEVGATNDLVLQMETWHHGGGWVTGSQSHLMAVRISKPRAWAESTLFICLFLSFQVDIWY